VDEADGIPLDEGLRDGFVRSGAGGLNLNLSPSSRTDWQSSYMLSDIREEAERSLYRENFLGDALFPSTEDEQENRQSQIHRLNSLLRHRFDSTRQLSLRTRLGWQGGQSDAWSERLTYDIARELETLSRRQSAAEGKQWQGGAELGYMQRLAKPGRTLSASLKGTLQHRQQQGQLDALNQLAINHLPKTDSLAQSQTQALLSGNYGLRLSYTEPLGARTWLGFSLRQAYWGDEVQQWTYDYLDPASPEGRLLDALSNHYRRGYTQQQAGLNLRWKGRHLNLQGGLDLERAALRGDLIQADTSLFLPLLNLLPQLHAHMRFSSSRQLFMDYQTQVRPPSLTQLQPLVDNRDPLRVYVGNPELRAEYQHQLNWRYTAFSQYHHTHAFLALTGLYTAYRIAQAVTLDSLFRQQVRPVNVDGEWLVQLMGSLGAAPYALRSRLSLSPRLSYLRSWLWVNGAPTLVSRWQSGGTFQIENRNKKVLDIALGADLRLNHTNYAEAPELNQTFLNHRYFADLRIKAGKRWRLSSRLEVRHFAGDAFAERQTIPLWEAALSHYFLQDERAELRLSAFDLLNRNQGVSRTTSLNYIEEQRVRSLGRYVMLSFTYRLQAVGTAPGAGVQIQMQK